MRIWCGPILGAIRSSIPAGAFIVTTGSDRRETGTHYTPKSVTEAIVAQRRSHASGLRGPGGGLAPREQWALISPAQAAGPEDRRSGHGVGGLPRAGLPLAGGPPGGGLGAGRERQGKHGEAWTDEVVEATEASEARYCHATPRRAPSIARRLIAERCLYGVDREPAGGRAGEALHLAGDVGQGASFWFS
jgi:hypothetical protein